MGHTTEQLQTFLYDETGPLCIKFTDMKHQDNHSVHCTLALVYMTLCHPNVFHSTLNSQVSTMLRGGPDTWTLTSLHQQHSAAIHVYLGVDTASILLLGTARGEQREEAEEEEEETHRLTTATRPTERQEEHQGPRARGQGHCPLAVVQQRTPEHSL
ncbi:hypothetical protein EYF80_054744 [Liparis tanakae]|uniref:Uncharacterized protein n=1 Tax=Liparis tanakae TaxID=230148 RepID=A0A4Z2F333_9TELE|nr:hypothetical protein EYF80_054744 [Liparis tanakae]